MTARGINTQQRTTGQDLNPGPTELNGNSSLCFSAPSLTPYVLAVLMMSKALFVFSPHTETRTQWWWKYSDFYFILVKVVKPHV